MKEIAIGIGFILWIVVWTVGAVIAKGFWSTVAVLTTGGIWSLYLILELILKKYGII